MRLALTWGPGGYSMQRVAAGAGERGIATLTHDALIQRLRAAVPYLQAVIRQLLQPVKPWPCLLHRSFIMMVGISQQARKATDWRVHGVYDLGSGGFSHLEVTDSHGGEALDRGAAIALDRKAHRLKTPQGKTLYALSVRPKTFPSN